MEIELPDGTILEAPDDADTRQVVRGYNMAKLKAQNPGEYDPKSEAFQEKFGAPEDTLREGIGSGMVGMTRKIGNLENTLINKHPLIKLFGGITLPHSEFHSDEAVKQQQETDAPLSDTAGGTAGQVVGETAVTAPISGPFAGLRALSTGGRILGRTLAAAPVRAALEGATVGSAAASPDERGEGATKGAAASAIIDRFMKGGGRMVRGLVKKSQAAEELGDLAAQHGDEIDVPISQAAGDQDWITRLAKSAYQEALPLIPGVKGKLERQSQRALAKTREIALKEASPEGTQFPANAGENIGEAVHSIDDSIAREYAETVGSLDYIVPNDLPSSLVKSIRSAQPDADQTTVNNAMKNTLGLMKRFSSGESRIEGKNLLNVRNELQKLTEKAPDYERGSYEAAASVIEDMIQKRLKLQGLARRYSDIAEPERQFKGLAKAAEAARNRGGNFSMDQLAQHAADPTQRYLAATAGEIFRESPAKSSMTGRILAGLGIGGYGAFISPGTAAGTFVAGNALATKTVQRALLGDTTAQRRIAKLIEDHPEKAEEIQQIIRTAMAASAGDSDGGS